MTPGSELRPRLQAIAQRLNNAGLFKFIRSAVLLFSARRCFGMSAEAAFWSIFTLPFLVLGLVAATAGVAQLVGEDVTQQVRQAIIEGASRVLTPEAVNDFLVPLLDGVMEGSSGLTILGFVAALWSGSRIFATFGEGSVAIHGLPVRNYFKTRALALLSYGVGLLAVAIIVVSIVLFPEPWSILVGLAPGGGRSLALLLVFLFLVTAATSMMYIVNPMRRRWRAELPGGALSVVIWLIGSLGLQLYFAWLFRTGSIYGAIASLVAVLVWALVTTTAVFVGMTLNQTIDMARRGDFLTRERLVAADLAGRDILRGTDPDVAAPADPDGAAPADR